ncbi:PO24 protein, partial [Lophotis ruficrista]|nr:PO24 protein [Lophotis ruficrista]
RANICPTREFLARGRQELQVKSCRHCLAENESCPHIIGYCPVVQDMRIKRHNQLCESLANEAKKKDWIIFNEPLLKSDQNELDKPDLIFVKDNQALVVDMIIRYETPPATSLVDAANEKVKKCEHLKIQIQELTNCENIKFYGFPIGARGKWHQGNYELLTELGLSSSRREKVARQMSNRALFTSLDIMHIFMSKSRSVMRS